MNLWARIKAWLYVGGVSSSPTVTVDFPRPKLPDLPKVTTHTVTTIFASVSCALSSTPSHDFKIVIRDGVVKSILSPCDRVAALTAAQLGGESCGRQYAELRARLSGKPAAPKPWTTQWIERNEPLEKLFAAADVLRAVRARSRDVVSTRPSSSAWMALIKRVTGLPARMAVVGRINIDTPGADSLYSYSGNDNGGGIWALAQGPGDQRVYDLLNKYVGRTSKLAPHP